MRRLIIVVVTLTGCASSLGLHVRDQYKRTVRIFVDCPEGVGVGSGVVVSDNTIATASHVITCEQGPPEAIVIEGYSAVVTRDVPSEDLALLRVDGFQAPPIVLGPRPDVGDRVCQTHAHPRSGRSCGEVIPAQPGVAVKGTLFHTAVTDTGNSGGPLWDAAGRLVGITTHWIACNNSQICGGRATPVRAEVLK